MPPEWIPVFLRNLGLNRTATIIIWRQLQANGMYKGSLVPGIPEHQKYTQTEILNMSPEWILTFVTALNLTDSVRTLIFNNLNRLHKIQTSGLKYLSGITQIDYITGTYNNVNRRFYLFYDLHNLKGECPPDLPDMAKVSDWLLQKLARHDSFIDFFLEVSPTDEIAPGFAEKFIHESELRAGKSQLIEKRQYAEGLGTIAKLAEDLEPCYNYNLFTECPYRDVRVHFADTRGFLKLVLGPEIEIEVFYRWLWELFNTDKFDKHHYTEYMLRMYINKPDSKFYQEWQKTPFAGNWKFMVTQILDIAYEIIQHNRRFEMLFSIFSELREKYGVASKDINNLPHMIVESLNSVLSSNKILRFAGTATFGLQDVYAIARMFKRFSGEPKFAQNIVYYAGGHHCRVVRRFLTEVLRFKLQYQTDLNLDRQCVDIQNLPWAF